MSSLNYTRPCLACCSFTSRLCALCSDVADRWRLTFAMCEQYRLYSNISVLHAIQTVYTSSTTLSFCTPSILPTIIFNCLFVTAASSLSLSSTNVVACLIWSVESKLHISRSHSHLNYCPNKTISLELEIQLSIFELVIKTLVCLMQC